MYATADRGKRALLGVKVIGLILYVLFWALRTRNIEARERNAKVFGDSTVIVDLSDWN